MNIFAYYILKFICSAAVTFIGQNYSAKNMTVVKKITLQSSLIREQQQWLLV